MNEITGGKPIPFKDGRPDFSEWSEGDIGFEEGVLDGSKGDFSEVYDVIKDSKNLPSKEAAKIYLKNIGLTPHHFQNTVIQLVPTKIHSNIPHIGSASDMRKPK